MGGATDLLYVEGLRSTGVQFRGSLSTGVSSPTAGTAEGTLLPFPEKANIFRHSSEGYVTRPGVGLSRSRSFLVFLFPLLYETRKLVEDNGLPGIQRRCGRGGERRRRWCCSCQNQRTGRCTHSITAFLSERGVGFGGSLISQPKTWFLSILFDAEFIMIGMWRHFGAS